MINSIFGRQFTNKSSSVLIKRYKPDQTEAVVENTGNKNLCKLLNVASGSNRHDTRKVIDIAETITKFR